jgi:hypothetical protein
MKKSLLLLLNSFLFVSVLLANEFDGTTFTISSDVSLPVYVEYGGGRIKITSYHYTTRTRILNATITDARGNQCIYNHTYNYSSGSKSYVHHYYNITGVYSSSSGSNNSSSSYGSSRYSASQTKTKKERENRGGYVWNETNMPYFYPNLHLRVGFSPLWGEYADLKLHIGHGIGFTAFGGVGYDWACYPDRSMPIDPYTGKRTMSIDKMTWNAGIGFSAMYQGDWLDLEYDITTALIVGRTTTYAPCSMLADFSSTFFVGDTGIFGFYFGAGLGGTLEKDIRFQWDARFGIAINFLQFDWF